MCAQMLSILIPAYNEAATIHLILNKVLAVKLTAGILKEVIIVNDCSRDDTEKVVSEYIRQHPEVISGFSTSRSIRGKGLRSIKGLSLRQGNILLFRMLTLSMIRRNIIFFSSLFLMVLRMLFTDRGSWEANRTGFCFSGILLVIIFLRHFPTCSPT
jgi:glycosyltransferase involved in cell wall biosynthesis